MTTDLLWDNWFRQALARPDAEAVVHWQFDQAPVRWTWARLVHAAWRYAAQLERAGVRRGSVCALVIRHHPEFYPLYLGIAARGAIPAVLAYPNPRLHPDKFRQGLEGMSRHSGLDWVLSERSLEELVRPLVLKEGSTIRGLLFPLEWPDVAGSAEPQLGTEGTSRAGARRSQVDPPVAALADAMAALKEEARADEPCLLQHSSGTTGLQKAVALSHRAVLEHVRRYGDVLRMGAGDKVVSWLPLYHDMGLIAAFQLPLARGVPIVQLDPFEWVRAPVLLLEAVSKERGTLAWLPNFAYNLMADRIHDEDLDGLRLDSVRMLINCSEPVRYDSHEKFLRRFTAYGLKPEALTASYAMAETTFAVTQTPPGAPARAVAVSREAFSRGRMEPAGATGVPPVGPLAAGVTPAAPAGDDVRRCVSSGAPLAGCELKVVDKADREVPDGQVGEVLIRSVSMFDGYRNDPAKTAEVLRDGWYHSGDYGCRYEGEYFILGRKKDLIIVAGKNIYPEDIEDAVSEVPGVLPGRVVAFGLDDAATGTEQVCVMAETERQGEGELKALRRAVLEAGMSIDVTVAQVYLVPPRWLFKSSSGKPSRKANKQRLLQEQAAR